MRRSFPQRPPYGGTCPSSWSTMTKGDRREHDRLTGSAIAGVRGRLTQPDVGD